MPAAVANAPVQTFIVSFDPKDNRAKKLWDALKLMDFLTIEKSPYSQEFVSKIRRSEKSKKHFVDVATLWD